MNAKASLFATVSVSGLLGCTTAPDPEKVAVAVVEPLPKATFVYSYEPKREMPGKHLFGQTCRLSTTKSCMDLDSRPFEPCLVTTKTCAQEGAEILRADLFATEPAGSVKYDLVPHR